MSVDDELERINAKRLAEMKKNIAQKEHKSQESKKPQKTPRDVLVSRLGYRGLEVLENAEYQYPQQVPFIITKIAELVNSGEISEVIDGGGLLELLIQTCTQAPLNQVCRLVSSLQFP